MKHRVIGALMLLAIPVILISGIWGKAIGDFAVAHFANHRPALTACFDSGSVVVTRTWWASDLVNWSSEDFPNWSDAKWEEEGYVKRSKSETFLYCSPFLTRAEAEDLRVSDSSVLNEINEREQSKITNDGRYMNDSVRTYSLDVGNLVRASIMLVLGIGGIMLVANSRRSQR